MNHTQTAGQKGHTTVRRLLGITLWCALSLLSAEALRVQAQQPAPSPTPTPSPTADPIAVVKAYFDAINRGDANAAADFFTDNPVYVGLIVCYAPNPCTSRSDIAAGIPTAYFPNLPITVVLERYSPTTVIARGQGEAGRLSGVYFESTFEISGDRIAVFRAERQDLSCTVAPSPDVCPQYNPNPPASNAPGQLPPPGAAAASSTSPAAAATTQGAPVGPPAVVARQTPLRASGTAGRLLLAALAAVGLAIVGLLMAALGVLMRRRTPAP